MNRTIEEVDERVKYVTDVFCNSCGKSCKKGNGLYGLIDTKVRGGYYSSTLDDMTTYVFSLCEECLCEIFKKFSLPAEKYEDVVFGESTAPRFKYNLQILRQPPHELSAVQLEKKK